MANAVNVNFRMDPDLKRSMEEVCAEMGLSMTTAFTIFAKKVSREHRIPFEVSADRFCQQAAVLGDFRCHQFPCPFDLVQVLHRSLRVRQVFQHFVLDAVDTVEGHRYGGFCGYDTLLEFPPLLVDAFQFRCLCHNRCGQGRVSLLGEDGNAPCAQSQQDGKSRQSLFDED